MLTTWNSSYNGASPQPQYQGGYNVPPAPNYGGGYQQTAPIPQGYAGYPPSNQAPPPQQYQQVFQQGQRMIDHKA